MISTVRLQHFRLYTDLRVSFVPGVNIIAGPNASGKTSLIEAILVLATGSSYRAKDQELIQFEHDWARLEGQTPPGQRIVKLEHIGHAVKKSYVINDHPLQVLRHERQLPVVVFEPEHMQLLTGTPDLRRLYMDTILMQLVPGFQSTRQHYKRSLTQRNALLKQNPARARGQLFPWNIRLSDLGGYIARQRFDLLQNCNTRISEIYSSIAGATSQVELHYKTPFTMEHYSSHLLKQLEVKTDLDFQRGFTAYGPHREDLQVLLNGHPADSTASRGETRTLLLALKMLELRLVEEARRTRPMLLLDDVFSELDAVRRRALTDCLSGTQTFITTTDADVVKKHFGGKCHIISSSHE